MRLPTTRRLVALSFSVYLHVALCPPPCVGHHLAGDSRGALSYRAALPRRLAAVAAVVPPLSPPSNHAPPACGPAVGARLSVRPFLSSSQRLRRHPRTPLPHAHYIPLRGSTLAMAFPPARPGSQGDQGIVLVYGALLARRHLRPFAALIQLAVFSLSYGWLLAGNSRRRWGGGPNVSRSCCKASTTSSATSR